MCNEERKPNILRKEVGFTPCSTSFADDNDEGDHVIDIHSKNLSSPTPLQRKQLIIQNMNSKQMLGVLLWCHFIFIDGYTIPSFMPPTHHRHHRHHLRLHSNCQRNNSCRGYTHQKSFIINPILEINKHSQKSKSLLLANSNNMNENEPLTTSATTSATHPMSFQDMIQTLNSYGSNISRTRAFITNNEGKKPPQTKVLKGKEHTYQNKQQKQQMSISCMIAIRSFVRKLQLETKLWKEYNSNNTNRIQHQHQQSSVDKLSVEPLLLEDYKEDNLEALQSSLNNAIIQSIRSSADYGDYNMIMNIIDTSIQYNTQIALAKASSVPSMSSSVTSSMSSSMSSSTKQIPLLQARIFGEAITELQRTDANMSKIKKVWKQLLGIANHHHHHDTTTNNNNKFVPNLLIAQPSAYEFNTMLLALSNRGRVRAALSLYYSHIFGQRMKMKNKNHGLIITTTTTEHFDDENDEDGESLPIRIDGDTYTASTIMSILAESIANDSNAMINQRPSQYSSKQSPCWQWREAELILEIMENDSERRYHKMLNNHVYAAVLKVNDEASELYNYPGNMHHGSKMAMSVLERMRCQNISPDVVTCSAVMSTFDKGKQWKAALALLKSMEMTKKQCDHNSSSSSSSSSNDDDDDDEKEEGKWKLPRPNEYSYASAISSCARSGQFDEAINILDGLRLHDQHNTNDDSSAEKCSAVTPNIWIYNAALASCLPTHNYRFKKKKVENNVRSKTAIKILRRMEEDAESGLNTAPDTVSYNTVIAAVGGLFSRYLNGYDSSLSHDLIFCDDATFSEAEINAMKLLQEMKDKNIQRDPITYRNAILTCRKDENAILRLLDIAIQDISTFKASVISKWGAVDDIKRYFLNVALSVCETNGGMNFAKDLFEYMSRENILADSLSMSHLLKALGSSGSSDDSMLILNAMKGDGAANALFVEEYGIDVIASGNFLDYPLINEYHYSSSITYCLQRGELFSALKILNGMKVHGLKPNEESLQGIIFAYCKLSIDASSIEFKEARIEQMKKGKAQRRNRILPVKHTTSRTRATAALAMLNSMNDPPTKLKSSVASACAASGMWTDARTLLWSIHSTAVQQMREKRSTNPIVQGNTDAISALPRLHRSLLKLCARSGNITAALWYARAIQDFVAKLERQKSDKHKIASRILKSLEEEEEEDTGDGSYDALKTDVNVPATDILQRSSTGDNNLMGVEEWKYVNIAASKSCHWKICLGVLQFIQPYVEMTHPKNVMNESNYGISMDELNRNYDEMARILTDSVLAFELRSQYAWAVRAIYDWIEWSGRRPKREAMYSVCRVLASRGLGHQVNSLISTVLQVTPCDGSQLREDTAEIPSYEDSYERGIYTEAITALFQSGLYDNADELYANAVSGHFLPWAVVDETKSEHIIEGLQLDLHGMNKAMAHSAVRVSLQHLIQSNSNLSLDSEITIITGRGKRSSQHLRPVLRPEVQRMLLEEFYPPLGTSSIPGNMGVLKVSVAEVDAWVQHQQQQKGVRFLAVADALRSLTSGERLKKVLQKTVNDKDATATGT